MTNKHYIIIFQSVNKNDIYVVFICFNFLIRGEYQSNTMPKVNQEYFENKKRIILDAAVRVFLRKPAYSVTMNDIVKESQLSRGVVYKYYSNIDDIIISLLNGKKINVNPKSIIEKYNDEPERAIFEYFKKFFFIAASEFGKIMFELHPIFFNDNKRFKKLKKNINKDVSLYFWFAELFLFIDCKIEEKYFKPLVDHNDIYMQIIATINGIGKELILTKYYDFDILSYYYKDLQINLNNLIDNLYKTVLFLLGSRYSFDKITENEKTES